MRTHEHVQEKDLCIAILDLFAVNLMQVPHCEYVPVICSSLGLAQKNVPTVRVGGTALWSALARPALLGPGPMFPAEKGGCEVRGEPTAAPELSKFLPVSYFC